MNDSELSSNSYQTKSRLSVGCYIGAVVCLFVGVDQFGVSDSEIEDRNNLRLSADAFLTQQRIGYEYGASAARFWCAAVHDGDKNFAQQLLSGPMSSEIGTKQIERAVTARFAVSPDKLLEEKIMRDYIRLRDAAAEIERRRAPLQRFKDLMAWVGGASVLGLVGFKIAQNNTPGNLQS